MPWELRELIVRERHVRSDNGRCIPDRVEDLGGSICGYTIAGSHHDEADYPDEKHQAEALRTAPGIEDLRQRKLDEASDKGGDDGSSGGERVHREGTCHVRGVSTDCNLLDGGNDVEEPDAVVKWSECGEKAVGDD